MSEMVYLYGFVPADAPAPPAALRGMADGAVELLRLDGAAAVMSRVPAADYAPGVLEERLQQLAWVGEQGVAHERVVLWFVDHSDILPARLFSLYSGVDALRAAAEPRVAVIAARIRALAGRREWNLKVAYDAAELGRHAGDVSAEMRRLDEEITGAPPGRRYLLERKRGDLLRGEVARAARRLAGEILDALRPLAEDVRVLPLAGGDDTGTVVLNAALLVNRDAEEAFRTGADTLIAAQRDLGMLPALSGPWAPYRFLETDAG